MHEPWDRVALIRKKQIESGADLTFCKIFVPYYKKHFQKANYRSLLEIGCGTGHLAKMLSVYVPKLVALEPSKGMYLVAKEVLKKSSVELLNITANRYSVPRLFDVILSHMCVQALSNLDLFLVGIRKHLKKSSTLILTLPHPCFYNDYKMFFSSEEYLYMESKKKIIDFSITLEPNNKITNVLYQHRPLSEYFATFQRNGICVRLFEEVVPTNRISLLYGKQWKTPRYCVFICGKQ